MDGHIPGAAPLSSKEDLVTTSEKLNLFSKAVVSDDIINTEWIELHPTNQVNPSSKEFIFEHDKCFLPRYLSLDDMCVTMKARIVKEESPGVFVPMELEDNIAPADFLPDTIWQSVDIYFNEVLVSQSPSYRSRFVDLLR